jgi:hypothetical protein
VERLGFSPRRSDAQFSSILPPHPKQATGGQVFPQFQIAMFPGSSGSTSSPIPGGLRRSSRRPSFSRADRSSGRLTGRGGFINNFHRLSATSDAGPARRAPHARHAVPRRSSIRPTIGRRRSPAWGSLASTAT